LPRLRVASGACPRAAQSADPWDEPNAWLLDQRIGYAKANKHPELADQTIWPVFEAERAALAPIGSRFDGFRATQAAVSKTCLVRFDNNKRSVSSRAVGRPVEIQAYAERIVIRQAGAIVGEHARRFGRNQTDLRPLALRAGARPQARCAQERRAVQGLAAAGQCGARAAG
jgi:hypothetical protein